MAGISGNTITGWNGDGGPATSAFLNCSGVTVDGSGSLYIADSGNRRVRKVSAAPATLSAAPASLSLTTLEENNPPPLALALTASPSGSIWQAAAETSSGGAWLSVSPSAGLLPSSLTVLFDAAGLPAGTYQGTVTIQTQGSASASLAVPVQLTVAGVSGGRLAATLAAINVQATMGSGNPQPQSIVITTTGGPAMSWTASTTTATGGSWLAISPFSGTASLATPITAQISFNTQGLQPGVYSGRIVISSGGQPGLEVPARLVLSSGSASLLVSKTGLLFTAVSGGSPPPPQSVAVVNTGQGAMNWSVSVPVGNWLLVTPFSSSSTAGAQSPPSLLVQAIIAGLPAGVYSGLVRATAAGASNSPQYISVVLNLLPSSTKVLNTLQPGVLLFTAQAGAPAPAPLRVTLTTTSATIFSTAIAVAPGAISWLSASPATLSLSASASSAVSIGVNPASLPPGVYSGAITLVFGDGSPPQDINVALAVTPGGSSCTPSKLTVFLREPMTGFTTASGWPANLHAHLWDDCGNPARNATVAAASRTAIRHSC